MDTRERKSHPCGWCVTVAKWIPVVFIAAIIVWSYYAYVIQLCLITVTSVVEKAVTAFTAAIVMVLYQLNCTVCVEPVIWVAMLMANHRGVFYLIVYHVTFTMFAWSYWQTIFVTTPDVPKQFWLRKIEKDNSKKELGEEHRQRYFEAFVKEFNLPVACRTESGGYRHCAKCQLIKPDRAHHCSACDRCVLKMDHHCPWVNNCVCFQNYKFFVLFLGYSLLYCLFIGATSLQYFIKFWRNELIDSGRFHILFLFFMAVMFAISLASLFCYHCYLSSVNRTTLESFRAPVFRTGPDKDGFSLGKYNNFVEVFGNDRKKWCLPIFTSFSKLTRLANAILMLFIGNGIEYPTRTPQAHSYNSMGNTQPSVGEGVTFPQRMVDDDTDELLSRQRWAEEADDGLNQVERGAIVAQQSASRSSVSSDVRLLSE